MDGKVDGALRAYFGERARPSPEARAALRGRLAAAERKKDAWLCWAAVANAIMFTAAVLVAAWAFFGAGLVFFAFAGAGSLSAACGVAITIACQMERRKERACHVDVFD